MYSALLIAKYIVKRCNEKDRTVSNLKLQKLLYFVQAQFLVYKGEACFPEEIEAWDFGPVVPEVYHVYKVYGSANIPYTGYNTIIRINSDDKKMINEIVDECSQYTASALVEITHNQTPWKSVYRPYRRNIITKKSIRDFFTED